MTLHIENVYDNLGRMVENTDAEGYVSKVEYNEIGKQAAYIDKLGNRTEYEYDVLGNLSRVRYPDGTEETFTYDAEGRNLTSRNREGKETSYVYDKLGRLTETHHADNSYTETVYDARGQVLQQFDERRNETRYEYDAAGRNTAVINALNQTTRYEYNTNGSLKRLIDANNYATEYEYDANGWRTKTIFDDSTFVETAYDDAGRVTGEWDQNRKHSQFEYDWRGKLTQVTDALNFVTTFEYDEVGNMIGQTDARQKTTRFEYDNLGRMTKRILPLGQEETMVYDGEDNLLQKTDFNNRTIEFTYDADGRLTGKIFPDGKTEEYTYTRDGSQQTIIDDRGTTVFEFDTMGRLQRQINPDGSYLAYSYDEAGNRTSVETPSGTVTYTYDELNRLKTVDDPQTGTTTYTYDDVGNLKTVTLPNGTTAEYTYDTLNRLINLVNKKSDGSIISSYTYTLDAAGNRTKVEEHTGRIVEYVYDDTYKLLKETIKEPGKEDRVFSYTYDEVGNRLTKVENGFTTTYVYDDNNRLIREDDIIYRYDNNGNLIEKDSAEEQIRYTYDYENHLTRVETTRYGATIVVDYDYDAHGNRVRKTIDGLVTTTYLVDENRDYAQVLEERTAEGALICRYVYGHDLISQTRDGATTYYHYDGLGSTRALTNSSEAVTDTYTYDAFGLLLEQTGTTENAYLYRGEQFDEEIGFYYLRARYMAPSIGRFVTMDTFAGFIRDPYSLHKYLYANANPVNRIDPSGQYSLIETQIAGSIRSILAQVQIDVGMAIFDQVVFGGNSGLGTLAFGGVMRLGGALGRTLLNGVVGRLSRSPRAAALLNRILPAIAAHICKLKYLSPVFAALAVNEYQKMKEALEQGDIRSGMSAFYKCIGYAMFAVQIWRTFACFPEDTLIYTKEGNKPIQDIKVGDEVYSENVETGEQGFKRVKKVFVRETRVLVHLFLDDVEIITTPEHPFWVPEKGWIPAGELKIGEFVKLASDDRVEITSITREVLTEPITVYNFEVENWHTYFVSQKGILVHNQYRYKGGRHKNTKRPTGDNLDSHHIPAKESYRHTGFSPEEGLAIQMDKSDHRMTASYGSSRAAQAYRDRQRALINQGLWLDAIQMDIDDIRSKFGSKYDGAIQEALEDIPNSWL